MPVKKEGERAGAATAEKMEEKGFELFDSWMESQREFSESWLKSQSDLLENWINTTKSLQQSFLTLMVGEKDGGTKNDMTKLIDSWRTIMYDSSKVFTDGIMRIQEGWRAVFEKQMEMSKEIARKNMDIIRQAEKK